MVGEEVDADGKPELDCAAGDRLDLATIDAEIGKLAVRQTAKLVHRLAISTPVAVSAEQVHFSSLFGSDSWVPRTRFQLDGFTRDEVDVAAGDAEVGQFAVRQAAQLGDSLTVAAPVAVIADQVHLRFPFVFFRSSVYEA